MRFGSLRLDVVSGRRFRLDGEAVFGVIPRALWERRFPADASERVGLAANCLLVRGDGFTVLVDAGPGTPPEGTDSDVIEEGPDLVEELRARGVAAGDVDALVLSRLRFDRAGAATLCEGEGGRSVPVFPRAALYVQAAELANARNPRERDRAAYRSTSWETYAEAGLLRSLDGAAEIRPGVTAVPLPGHPAGLQGVRVDSAGKTAFFFADALPTAAHVPIPWIPSAMASELYPVELLAHKKRLLDEAAAQGWLCVFEHDHDVPWGILVDELNGKRRVHVVAADREEF